MTVETEPRAGETPADAYEDTVRFIGNATLLIRYGSLTILTDPNFVHRDAEIPLGFGLTTTRRTDPAVEADDVAQPDVVILSHDHGDHFDAVAADWLDPSVPIVTCPAAAGRLEEKGFGAVRPLRTWETTEIEKDGTRLRVTAVPAQHAPVPLAVALPQVTGTVLELWRPPADPASGPGRARTADAKREGKETGPAADLRIYISGDTVLHDALAGIRDRFGEIDLAFIHLGGMRVLGLTISMDAVQGLELINLLQPRITIPIHYNDYGTAKSSLADFVARVNQAGLADRVRYLRHGDAWPLPTTARRPA